MKRILLFATCICAYAAAMIGAAETDFLIGVEKTSLKPEKRKIVDHYLSKKTTKRKRVVEVNTEALASDELSINTFGSKKISVAREKSNNQKKVHKPKGMKNWIGGSNPGAGDGKSHSRAVLTINDKMITGTISTGVGEEYEVYLLLPIDKEGTHILIEQDWRKFGLD